MADQVTTTGTAPGTAPAGTRFANAAGELVATLADEEVDYLFINPGTDTAPVQEALAGARASGTPSPRAVLCTHEFVALSSAMGHYAASGKPQALMVHVDAGTLNLGGALHNAQRGRVPAVIFAGRSPYTTAAEIPGHRDSPIHWQQEQLDQQAPLRAFGKWTMEVPRGRELGGIVRRAFQVARSDPAGPAYVMLPREALMEPAGTGPARRLLPPWPTPATRSSSPAGPAPARRRWPPSCRWPSCSAARFSTTGTGSTSRRVTRCTPGTPAACCARRMSSCCWTPRSPGYRLTSRPRRPRGSCRSTSTP